jgi:DNA modification methylase
MVGIWPKPTGQTMNPQIRLANAYEMFFYAWKGQPALNKAGRSNVFNYSPVPPTQKTHPTERPVELTTEIYNTFAFPGSRVLIPFLGSGNGLISAYSLGMSAVGFEKSKSYRDSFLVKISNGIEYLR